MKTAMIRKALLSTLAATAVMTATPALAQQVTFSVGVGSPGYSQGYGYNRGYGNDLQYRAQRLAQQINRAAYNGRVSRGEAQRLSWEMQQYRSLEWRYARDGRLTQREYAALSHRLDRIQTMLRMDRRDRW